MGPTSSSTATPGKIPELTTVAPSLFTALTVDITKPAPELKSREERLRHIIKVIDEQRDTIRENLLWIIDRERQRISQEAREVESKLGKLPTARPCVSREEMDEIIENMAAIREQPSNSYCLPPNQRMPTALQLPPPKDALPRERTFYDILLLVERSIGALDESERYWAGVKDEYVKRLEAEITRFAQPAHQDTVMTDMGSG